MARFYKPAVALSLAAIMLAGCDSAVTPVPTPTAQVVGSPTQPKQSSAQQPQTPTSPPTSPPSPDQANRGTPMSTSQPTAQSTASETQIRVIIGDTVLTGRLRG